MNLYQHAKNETVSSICSGEIVDLKILQSDWLRAFRSTSQEQILKFNNSVLAQKNSSLYNNFVSNLYIFYELINWPRNPTIISHQKIVYLAKIFPNIRSRQEHSK